MIVKCFIRLTPGVVRHLVRLPRMNIYRGRPRPELAQTPSLGLIESRVIRNNFERQQLFGKSVLRDAGKIMSQFLTWSWSSIFVVVVG